MAVTVAKLQAVVGMNTKGVEQGASKTKGLLSGLLSPIRRAGSALGDVGKIAGGILTAQLAGKALGAVKNFAVGAIEAGSDAEEAMSKFEVTFGAAAAGLGGDLDAFAAATGRSRYGLKTMAADFGAVLKGMKLSEGATADYSSKLAQLAVDVGSFANKDSAEVMEKFRAGITGEYEGLKSLGIVINAAALDQELLNQGIEGGAKAATQAQLVQARYNLIMAATVDAQGDAARTSDSWSNQMVALKAVWSDFMTDIGRGLTGSMGPLLKIVVGLAQKALPALAGTITGKVLPGIVKFAEVVQSVISNFAGGEVFDALQEGLMGLGVSADVATKIANVGEAIQYGIKDAKRLVNEFRDLATWTREAGGGTEMVARNLLGLGLEKIGLDEGQIDRVFGVINGVQDLATKARAGLATVFEGGVGGGASFLMTALGISEGTQGEITSTIEGIVSGVQETIGSLMEGDLGGALGGALDLRGMLLGLRDQAIQAVPELLTGLLESLQEQFPQLGPAIEIALQAVGIGEKLINAFFNIKETLMEALGEMFAELAPRLIALLPDIGELLGTALSGAGEVIDTVLADILPWIESFATDAAAFLMEQFGGIVSWFEENLPLIQETVETVLTTIQTVWERVWPILEQVLNGVWENIKSVVETAINAVLGTIKTIMLAINGDWEAAWEELKGVGETILNGVKEVVSNTLNTILGLFGTDLETLKGTVSEKFTGIVSGITDKVGEFVNAGKELINGLKKGIEDAWGEVKAKIAGLGDAIPQWLKDKLGIASPSKVMAEIGSQTMAGFEQGLSGGAAGALGAVAGPLVQLTQFFGDFAKSLGKYNAEAFEDFAKGLEKVIGSLVAVAELGSKISAGSAGQGNALDLSGWLDRFAEMALTAAARVDQIINAIDGSKLKGLSKGSRRIREMIDAVIVDFSAMKMAEIPDIGAYFHLFGTVFDLAIGELQRIETTYGPQVVESLAAGVGHVVAILELIKSQLEVKAPSGSFLSDLAAYFGVLPQALAMVVTFLQDTRAAYTTAEHTAAGLLGGLTELAGIVPTLLGVIGVGVDTEALSSDWRANLEARFGALPVALGLAVGFLTATETAYKTATQTASEVLEGLGKLGGVIGQVLGIVGAGLGGGTALASDWMANITAHFGALPVALAMAVDFLRDTRTQYTEAGRTAEAVLSENEELAGIVPKLLGLLGVNLGGEGPGAGFADRIRATFSALPQALALANDFLKSTKAAYQTTKQTAAEVLGENAELVGPIREIMGLLDLGKVFEGLEENTKATPVRRVVRRLGQYLTDALAELMPILETLKTDYGARVAAVQEAVTGLRDLWAAIGDMAGDMAGLSGVQLNPMGGFFGQLLDRLDEAIVEMTVVRDRWQELAALMRDVAGVDVPAMNGGGTGGAGTGGAGPEPGAPSGGAPNGLGAQIAAAIAGTRIQIEIRSGDQYQTIEARLGELEQVIVDMGLDGAYA